MCSFISATTFCNDDWILDLSYLRHDTADVIEALRDGVTAATDGDGTLCRVGKHFGRHLWIKLKYFFLILIWRTNRPTNNSPYLISQVESY